MNQRRALNYPRASVVTRGDSAFAPTLARAFERSNADDFDTLTHGFHSWPARLHRSIAAELLDGFSQFAAGKSVVDPFMGGGTTLVEAMTRGLPTLGIDLNPLALRVAKVRTRVTTAEERDFFARAVDAITESNLDRIRAKAPSMAPISREEAQWYDGHVLRGLAGLFEEIQLVEHAETKLALEVVFSSIVVKFSRQRADTSGQVVKKRIGRFTATEFFQEKGLELVQRWNDLSRHVPKDTPAPWLFESDARNVASIVRGKERQRPAPGVVITSPPYGGTYDYAQHHARRLPWLGLDDQRLLKEEIGARRNVADHHDGEQRWDGELTGVLNALKETIDDDSICVFVIGDGVAAGRFLPADEQIERLAQTSGLVLCAVASSKRPDWSARAPREEHLVAFRKVSAATPWALLPARGERVPPPPAPDDNEPAHGSARSRAWAEGNRPPRRPRDDDDDRSNREDRPARRPSDTRRNEGRKPERRKPEGRKPEARKPEGRKPEGRKPEGRKPEGRKPDAPAERSDENDRDAPDATSSKRSPRKAPAKPGTGDGKPTPKAKGGKPKKKKLSAKAKVKEKERLKAKTKERVKAKAKKASRSKKRDDG